MLARQKGPSSCSICQANSFSSSHEVAQHGKTPSEPPPAPAGQPLMVMTRRTSSATASSTAAQKRAWASARLAGSGCRTLPAALTAESARPWSRSSPARRSRSFASPMVARSRCGRGQGPHAPTPSSMSFIPRSAHHAKSSRRPRLGSEFGVNARPHAAALPNAEIRSSTSRRACSTVVSTLRVPQAAAWKARSCSQKASS